MKLPSDIPVYGDLTYRGKCPAESVEQVTFFNRLRAKYPTTLGLIALHPRNEGRRHYAAVTREKAEGLTKGASDIIIPGCQSFVCELKRRDQTKSRLEPDQMAYLRAAKQAGAFVCVALGADAATSALNDWILITTGDVSKL